MNFEGEIGFYNFENKIAHTFDCPVKTEQFSFSEQNVILNRYAQVGVEIFLVTKIGLLKLGFV